jgi:hypothetical protein
MLEGTIVLGTRTAIKGGVNRSSYQTPFELLAADKLHTTYARATRILSATVYTLGAVRPSALIPTPTTTLVSGNAAVTTSGSSQVS